MEKSYAEGFRNILRTLKSTDNSERYRAICTPPCTADEDRIWYLCERFWPRAHSDRDVSIEKYVANDCLDESVAWKYLEEINELLDKLGWE